MGLSKEVFAEQMNRLIALYPNWGLKADDGAAMKFWYNEFCEMSNAKFRETIDEYVKKEIRYPTIAGIMAYKKYERKKIEVGERE